MIKKLIKFLLTLIVIFVLGISYLSFFGIDTPRFNEKIKTEIVKINKEINIELKTVKFLLNPFDLSVNIKTTAPKVIVQDNELKLEFIKTNISLKAFINNSFSIDDLQVSTKAIELSDFINFIRLLKNSTELFLLDKIIKDGFLVADIKLNFDDNGKIKNNYEIKGFIKKGKLDFFKKYNIEDLNLLFKIKNNEYLIEDITTKFNQIKLSSQFIKIIQKNNLFLVSGNAANIEKDIDLKLFNIFFEQNLKDLLVENFSLISDNNFKFSVNKKLKISNLHLKSIINLKNLDYKNDLPSLKKYLPNFEELIKLHNHKISIDYKKNQLSIEGNGELIIKDKKDKIDYKIKKIKDKYFFDLTTKINENSLSIDFLDYEKKENFNSLLKLKGAYKTSSFIKFNSIFLSESNNSFLIKNLNLNNELKINSLDLVEFDYTNISKIRNQVSLKKNKKNYKIFGKSFDVTQLLNILLKDENKDENISIFENLTSNIDIKINKTYLDNSSFINDLLGKIIFIDNKINKVKLDSTFSNGKKLKFTINTNDNNEKITTLFSGHPKPLLKQYKFIKGFEEGVLDFYSVKKNNVSNSVLTIDNFKVQEVPVLAKLLTLASLQGIADLLTGEGIRFTDLEMKFSNKKGLMTIEEMYAIGPAISILMDGYIESKKLISLRGTLVPATTINRSIASIPLIGNILIGKKTGEGVFGVSFKIKGPPKDLKTIVNPVKTLTPRFITRTLEKLKKN